MGETHGSIQGVAINLEVYGWEQQTLGGMGGEGWTHPEHPGSCYSRGAAIQQTESDLWKRRNAPQGAVLDSGEVESDMERDRR